MNSFFNLGVSQKYYCIIAMGFSLTLCLIHYLSGLDPIHQGPQKEVVLTAQEIWSGSSISSPRFYSLLNTLTQKSAQDHGLYWQDVFSVTNNGLLYPKHCLLLSYIVAPFWGLLGNVGVLLLSQLFFLGIIRSMRNLSNELVGYDCSKVTLPFAICGSAVIPYVYGMSYDLFGTFLIVSGFDYVRRRPFEGSLIMMLSVFVRPAFILLIVPLLGYAVVEKGMKNIWGVVLGSALSILSYLSYNFFLWGGPFITAYHKFPSIQDGHIIFLNATYQFRLEILLSDWVKKLFDSNCGLLSCNFGMLFLALYSIVLLRRLHRWIHAGAILLCMLPYSILIFSYDGWDVGGLGNRYLLPVAVLSNSIASYCVAVLLQASMSSRIGKEAGADCLSAESSSER